jgi:hypothetical protein
VTSGNALDAAEARETAGDLARMQRHIQDLRVARVRLERKRDQMLQELNVPVAD